MPGCLQRKDLSFERSLLWMCVRVFLFSGLLCCVVCVSHVDVETSVVLRSGEFFVFPVEGEDRTKAAGSSTIRSNGNSC